MWDSNTIRTCSSWTSKSFSSTGMTCVWNKAGDRRQLVWFSPVCSREERWRWQKAASMMSDSSPKSHHSRDLQCHPTARSDSLSAVNTACLGCQRWEGGEAAVPDPLLGGNGSERRRSNKTQVTRQVVLGRNTSHYLGKIVRGEAKSGDRASRGSSETCWTPLQRKGEETERRYSRVGAAAEDKRGREGGGMARGGHAVSHWGSLGCADAVARKPGKEPRQFPILFLASAEQWTVLPMGKHT